MSIIPCLKQPLVLKNILNAFCFDAGSFTDAWKLEAFYRFVSSFVQEQGNNISALHLGLRLKILLTL